MRREVRRQALTPDAGRRLLGIYAGLARRGAHLLGPLLGGEVPRQWEHYPYDDAIDTGSGYQWFYHSHSPEDRANAGEHGHFHVFAHRRLWARRLASADERAFATLTGGPAQSPPVRHLLCIGMDAKGVPVSLFTVNSWVTGDRMLGARNTAHLLERMRLDTGHRDIDAVLECVVALYLPEIRALLAARDVRLFRSRARSVLEDRRLELLSSVAVV